MPTEDDIARLSWNVPKQEAGRITSKELSLSRANRSVRLFDHVVERLAAGQQPDREKVEAVGYLMRTTAVYGSGKFGAAYHEAIADRTEFKGPFQAEMLSVLFDPCLRARSRRTPGALPLTRNRGDDQAGTAAAFRGREFHRVRHGAVHRQSPDAPEQLDFFARSDVGAGPRPGQGRGGRDCDVQSIRGARPKKCRGVVVRARAAGPEAYHAPRGSRPLSRARRRRRPRR